MGTQRIYEIKISAKWLKPLAKKLNWKKLSEGCYIMSNTIPEEIGAKQFNKALVGLIHP